MHLNKDSVWFSGFWKGHPKKPSKASGNFQKRTLHVCRNTTGGGSHYPLSSEDIATYIDHPSNSYLNPSKDLHSDRNAKRRSDRFSVRPWHRHDPGRSAVGQGQQHGHRVNQAQLPWRPTDLEVRSVFAKENDKPQTTTTKIDWIYIYWLLGDKTIEFCIVGWFHQIKVVADVLFKASIEGVQHLPYTNSAPLNLAFHFSTPCPMLRAQQHRN